MDVLTASSFFSVEDGMSVIKIKRMIRIFTLLAFSILTIGQGYAQNYVNYNRDSRWFIGLNAGATWTTQTEVPYRFRGGYGLTFGKSFGMEQDKVFSWDLRARFLHAQFMGQSITRYDLDSASAIGLDHYGSTTLQTYQDSIGYFYSNYRTDLLRGSLELVLNTNRLRQRTGWNLSVFGGIGITGYHTATNLVDNNLQTYNYDNLSGATVSNLTNFQDNSYETDLVGDANNYEVDWMPSFGFGISKQVLPGIAIGLEHKMTWTRTNLFDGMPNSLDGTSALLNDKYHYTALTVKFHLFGGKHLNDTHTDVDDDVDVDVFDTNTNPPIINDPVSKKQPIVDIYDPNSSPYTTTESSFRLKANIYYVENRSGVTFKQDGNINTNFSFNPTTDQFESVVILHPGQNLFEIIGVNEAGSDYEAVIIIYQKEEEPRNPPIVTITNPPYTPYTANSPVFGLVSTVLNVDAKANIQVYLNGVNLGAFSYDLTSKVLNASLNLKEGVNTVTVTASNEVGSDSKTVQIIYKKPETLQPPVVTFINPGVDPYYTSEASINIRATALNVALKSDLTVLVNGNPITSFSFNTSTKEIIFSTSLLEGANFVEITGVNKVGADSETTTIIYTRPETPQPPIVTFVDPGVNPITVYSSSYNVTAKVEYVNAKSDITLKINGVATTLFSYSTSSDLMTFSTSLVEGSNVIEIKGVNAYGMDLKTTTIIYKRSIPQAPPIVNILYPAVDNVEFGSPNITLEASVLNVLSAADVNVWVNGVPTTDFVYNIYTKDLTLPLVLVEGTNVVKITGTNVAGTDSKTRLIKYKRPVVPTPPTVVFINPPTSPYVVDVAPYTITANTTHIDSKSQIVLKHNGVLIADAAYAFIGGDQIVYNATLITGSNIFEVSVENAFGADEDLAIINLEVTGVPCIIPTVGYISPVPYSTVTDPNVTIDAQINNHSVGTTVELKLNGISQGFMTYNAGTSIASKPIVLAEGSNAVTVIVTNDCGTNQATFTLNYVAPDAPCADPVLTPVGLSTFTTLESVIGITLNSSNVSAADDLSVKLNGAVIPHTFDAGTGTISIVGINLMVGVNSIVVTAKTDCGPAILVYSITRNECLAPVVSDVSPISGTSTEATSIVLTGKVSNAVAADIVVLLNGVSQTFAYNPVTDVLSQALSLATGVNTILIQVTTACGTSSKSISITRTIPCETIITNLISPATGTVTVMDPAYSIVLHATGLTNVGQIAATLNGVTVTPTFDAVSGNISLTGLTLVDGENTVAVGMTNACSKASVSYKITYNGCQPPVIVFNSIYPGMVVSDAVYNLSAVITNVSDASDLVLKVNGTALDFDFNVASHLLTANFPLVEGGNLIEIFADGCEKVNASALLTYEKPCESISHTLIAPISTSVTALESSYAVSLSALGVTSSEQIGVKLNGASIPFSFNPGTHIITIAGITLVDGTNNVVVSLKNECSSDVINYTIVYDGCEPPVITLGANPLAVTASSYSFEANITNVAGAGAIQLLLNGAPRTFVFDPVSGAIDANLTLVEGSNTIRIIANGCETVSRDLVVSYTIPCSPITYTLVHPGVLTASEADATYSISLIVNNLTAAGISVSKAGVSIPFTYVDNMLTINGIVLADGANVVTVNLSNACSSESISYTITHDDCRTPEIAMGANPLSTELSIYPFTATVSNIESADQIQLKLNGSIKPFTFDPITGTIAASLNLIEGANTIQVIATGCVTASEIIRVSYSIPCSPVSYSLVSPASLITDADAATTSISLNVAHVLPETVSAVLNGTPVAYTLVGGVLTIPSVALIEGSNTVVISIGNACSSETITYVINYTPCVAPSIVINGLTDGIVLVDQELMFIATLYNVDDAGEITLLFNGVAIPFEFNPASKLLQAPLSLTDGSNSIEIIVDGCVMTTSDVAVTYDAPCAAPSYTRITPASTDVTVEGDSYTITLTTTNVTEDQISVKVNGGTFPFTYSSGTVIIVVPFISVPTNNVQVLLANDCGTVSVDYSVTYILEEEDCVPTVSAIFGADNKSVTASSDKPLLNVILNLNDGTTQLIEDVSGMSGTFSPVGEKVCTCITGVWIRSGCNLSAAGEPFGDYVANPGWDGSCVAEDPCLPITYSLITPNRLSSSTTIANYSIVFSATNIESADNVMVLVNGVTRRATYSGGRVSLTGIILRAGSNTIQFTLTNDCSTQTITYTVSYTPPVEDGGGIKTEGGKVDGGGIKDGGAIDNGSGGTRAQIAPEIKPIIPVTTRETVKSQALNFKVKVENVSSKADIELALNGIKTQSFTFNAGTKELNAVLNLQPGVNMIKVKATSGSSKELIYYITYEKVVSEPVQNGNGNNGNGGNVQNVVLAPQLIKVSPSASTATTDKETYLFKVKTVNVMAKSDLILKLNGAVITNFTFSPSGQLLSAALRLREGANTVRVEAKNGNKMTALDFTITYKKPVVRDVSEPVKDGGGIGQAVVVKPVFKMVNPASSAVTVKSPTFVLKTNVSNVKLKSDLTLTVNGVIVTNFTFNPASGEIIATLTLKSGANSIRITAKNGDQIATINYTITYQALMQGVGGGNGGSQQGAPTNGGVIQGSGRR